MLYNFIKRQEKRKPTFEHGTMFVDEEFVGKAVGDSEFQKEMRIDQNDKLYKGLTAKAEEQNYA